MASFFASSDVANDNKLIADPEDVDGLELDAVDEEDVDGLELDAVDEESVEALVEEDG